MLAGVADVLHEEPGRCELLLEGVTTGKAGRTKHSDALILKMGRRTDIQLSFKGPVVVINNSLRDVPHPQVLSDDLAIGRMAAGYFLRRGFRRFVYATDKSEFGRLRGDGFVDALKKAGITNVPRSCGLAADHVATIRELLSRHRGEPVAVFCCNDWRANAVIHYAAAEGIECPRDLAVLGVDNDWKANTTCFVPISSIELPEYEIGQGAARLVVRMLRGEPPPAAPIRIRPLRVISRRSTDQYACDDERLLRAARFIEANSSRNVSVQDIAEAAGRNVAVRTLQGWFREAFGETMIHALLRHRVARAKSLLASGDLSVKEITYLTGFSDTSHFNRTFRRFEGMTPGAFRKRILSDTR